MTNITLSSAPPLTWSDLECRLVDAAARRLVPEASVPAIRSTLLGAVTDLVRQRSQLTELETVSALEALDLTPYLVHAEEAALRRAKLANHVRPGNAAARVNQALRAAVPDTFGGESLTPQQRVELTGAAWAPVFEAIRTVPHSKVHRRYMVILAETVWTQGIDGPPGLPTSADDAADLLRQAGLDETEISKVIHAYRLALRTITERGQHLPDAPHWEEHRTARRGIRRIGGALGDPEEALKRGLPAFHDLLVAWRAGPAVALRPKSRVSGEGALFRVAGLLERMHAAGALPMPSCKELHPLHLWQLRVRSPRRDEREAAADTSSLTRLLTPLFGASAATDAVRASGELTLAAAVGEWAVVNKVVERRTATGTSFFVPKTMAQDLGRVWDMVRGVFEPIIHATKDEEKIEQLEQLIDVAAAAERHFAELYKEAGEPTVKDKIRAVEHCTLPIMTCLVLPWWTMVELPGRQAAAAAYAASRGEPAARRSKYEVRRERSLRNEYETSLESWALQAVVTADPLRRAQVVYGRVGREYRIDADWGPDGALVRVLGVRSGFHGKGLDDNKPASLKQDHIGLREWQLSPSMLDPEWFATYMEQVWLQRLRRRGLVGPDTTLREAVECGRFALFVSADPSGSNPTYGYSESYVSTRFAKAFRVSLRALGHSIPDGPEAATLGWAMILGPHILRLYWATYWLGLREHVPLRIPLADGTPYKLSGLEVARRATTDSERALRRDYVQVSDKMRQMEREAVGTWKHPRMYDALMDRAYMVSDQIDWRAVWSSPDFPMADGMRAEFVRATTPAQRPARRRRRSTAA